MKLLLKLTIGLLCLNACQSKTNKRLFTSVTVNSIISDTTFNSRAITLLKDTVFIATSLGKILKYDTKKITQLPINYVSPDSNAIPHFRAIAHNGEALFTLSIASPALLFKNSNLVYTETHPKVFYDAMAFWNAQEGIAMGDPTAGCLSIIITRDGGNSWKKIPCNELPIEIPGEAAFAASNTNISIKGNNTWIATGGKASRIFYSPDKGHTWTVYNTPFVQGKATTGMYSVDFYNTNIGYAIGGDYTQPKNNKNNKIKTTDGGKTWQTVATNKTPGYRSCVQYIPKSNGKQLVAVGFKGIDYSHDGGKTWVSLSKQSFYTCRFINDSTAYAAGKGLFAKLTFK